MNYEEYLIELNSIIELNSKLETGIALDENKLKNIILNNNEDEIESLSIYEKAALLIGSKNTLFKDKLSCKEIACSIFMTGNDIFINKIIYYLEEYPKLLEDEDFCTIFSTMDDSLFKKSYLFKELLNLDIPTSLAHVLLEKIPSFWLKDFSKMNSKIKELIVNSDTFVFKLIKAYDRDQDKEICEYSRKIWEKHKDKIINLSINEQISFLSAITDYELKKQIFDELNMEQNLLMLNSNLLEMVDLDKRLNLLYDAKTSNSFKLTIFKSLSSDIQYEIIINPSLMVKCDMTDSFLFFYIKDETKIKLFEHDKSLFSFSDVFKLYDKTKNDIYFKYMKDMLVEMDEIDFFYPLNSDCLYDKLIRDLTEEEKKYIISKIIHPKNFISTDMFFQGSCEKDTLIFDGIFLKNAIEFMKNDESGKKYQITINRLEKVCESIKILEFEHKIDKNYLLNDSMFGMFSEEKFEKLISFLEVNPNFFSGDENFVPSLDRYFSNINYKYNKLKKYLNEKQLSYFYTENLLKVNKQVRESYIELVEKDLSEFKNFELLELLPELLQEKILKNVSIDFFMNYLIRVENIPNKIKQSMNERFQDIIDYFLEVEVPATKDIFSLLFNEFYGPFKAVYMNLSTENRKKFINELPPEYLINHYIDIAVDMEQNEKVSLFELLFSKFNQTEIYSYRFVDKVSREDLQLFMDKACIYHLMNAAVKLNIGEIITKVVSIIKNDINSIIDDSIISTIDRFLFLLNKEDREYIEEKINSKLENTKYYNLFKDKIDECGWGAKLNFLYGVEKNYLDDSKINFFKKLFEKDKFLLNNLNFSLFRDDIYSLGPKFIDKATRYYPFVFELKKIYDETGLGILIQKMSDYLILKNYPQDLYEKHMGYIIYFIRNAAQDIDIENIDLNDKNIENIMRYILWRQFVKEENEDIIKYSDDFINIEIKVLDNKMKNSIELDDAKNIFFQKYFGLRLETIKRLLFSYAKNYADVSEYASDDKPIKYIELIKTIYEINDVAQLKELYEKFEYKYNITEYLYIESIMKQAYLKQISEKYNPKNEIEYEKIFIIDGEEKKVKVSELTDDSGILVHSTCAYGSMPIINDDYFYSWQYNPNTANNGICCSYITNSNQGTADVTGSGVLFGFKNINENSISSYSPYDLVSINNGYLPVCKRVPFYTSIENIPNYTRHTHNEFVLFRRNMELSNEYPCVIPDCVVIYEDMPEEIKANSLKAVEDFRKHGIELEIVYRDRVKIAQSEASKLVQEIKEYYATNDLSKLASIINRYETNICGFDYISGVDKDELFKTNLMIQVLNDTLEYIYNVGNTEEKKLLLEQFIRIMDAEQYKFDVIEETVGNRAHTFDLYNKVRDKIEQIKDELTIKKGVTYG